MQFAECVEDDLGNNQAGIVLIIGRNHKPGCMTSGGFLEAFLKGLRVIFPICSLVKVGSAEFPVFLLGPQAYRESACAVRFLKDEGRIL